MMYDRTGTEPGDAGDELHAWSDSGGQKDLLQCERSVVCCNPVIVTGCGGCPSG